MASESGGRTRRGTCSPLTSDPPPSLMWYRDSGWHSPWPLHFEWVHCPPSAQLQLTAKAPNYPSSTLPRQKKREGPLVREERRRAEGALSHSLSSPDRKSALFAQLGCVNSPSTLPLFAHPSKTILVMLTVGRVSDGVLPSFLPSFSHGTMTEWPSSCSSLPLSLSLLDSSIPIVSNADRYRGDGSGGGGRLAFTTDSRRRGTLSGMHLFHFTIVNQKKSPESLHTVEERRRKEIDTFVVVKESY